MGDDKGQPPAGEETVDRLHKASKAERMLTAVLEQLPAAVMIIDKKTGHVTFANERAYAIAGKRGALGKAPGDYGVDALSANGEIIPPSRWPGTRALATGDVVPEELIGFRHDDGTVRFVRVNAAPVRDDDGEIIAAVVAYDDVTEQRRQEQSVQFVAEASGLLSSSLDYETTLRTFANLAVPRLADWCAVEIVAADGSREQIAVAHSDPEKIRFALELQQRYPPDPDAAFGVPNVLRTGKSEIIPYVPEELLRAGAKDEEHLRLILELQLRSAIVVPLVARGRVLGAITLVYAESERHYDERDLALAEEIASRAALATDNALLYRDAQRAIAMRDDFLSVASHELKTPLTSMHLLVGGVLRKLHRGQASDLKPERIRRLDAQLGRLAALIDQLLDVSRLNAGRFTLTREDVPLAALLEDVVERFRDEAAASGVTVSLDGAGDVVGHWDPQRLDQVFTNLLSNALKYGGGGPVEVTAERTEGGVRVVVRDHGPGVPEADLERIFERFERAASPRKQSGMGLGLWIARQMVEAHGGAISARSGTGEGAAFIVGLPLSARVSAARAPVGEKGKA